MVFIFKISLSHPLPFSFSRSSLIPSDDSLVVFSLLNPWTLSLTQIQSRSPVEFLTESGLFLSGTLDYKTGKHFYSHPNWWEISLIFKLTTPPRNPSGFINCQLRKYLIPSKQITLECPCNYWPDAVKQLIRHDVAPFSEMIARPQDHTVI